MREREEKKKVRVKKKERAVGLLFARFLFSISNCDSKRVPTSVFLCSEASVWCLYALLTAKIDQKQRIRGPAGTLLFVLDNGDGFFDRSMFSFSLLLSLDFVILKSTPKKNALEEAIATTLDLKCCLEAGYLRDDENEELGTEESLRKVASIKGRKAAEKGEGKKRKSEP